MTEGITSKKLEVQRQRTHQVRRNAEKGSSWPEHDAREDVYKACGEKRDTREHEIFYIPAAAAAAAAIPP